MVASYSECFILSHLQLNQTCDFWNKLNVLGDNPGSSYQYGCLTISTNLTLISILVGKSFVIMIWNEYS